MALGANIAQQYPFLNTLRSILAWSVLLYLRFFAKLALIIHPPREIIGIAGAVGKSTARNALAKLLSTQYSTMVVTGNSETGIPLGILGLDPGYYSPRDFLRILLLAPFRIFSVKPSTYLIVEMGIDGPLPPKNMSYLLTIVKPTIAILLNESPAHIGNYASIIPSTLTDSREKLHHVLTYMTRDDGQIATTSVSKIVLFNALDHHIAEFMKQLSPSPVTQFYTFGKRTSSYIHLKSYKVTLSGTEFVFQSLVKRTQATHTINIPGYILPKDTASSLGMAILTALVLGVERDRIEQTLTDLPFPPGRSSVFNGLKGSIIIDSSYNVAPASMAAFVGLMGTLKKRTNRPIAVLFGDMKELGEATAVEHGKIAKKLKKVAKSIYLLGPDTRAYVLPVVSTTSRQKDVQWFPSVVDAANYIKLNLPPNAILLVKGSQNLEEIIKRLLANPFDINRLCRQDDFWKKAKLARGTYIPS